MLSLLNAGKGKEVACRAVSTSAVAVWGAFYLDTFPVWSYAFPSSEWLVSAVDAGTCCWARWKYTSRNSAQNFGKQGMSAVLQLDIGEKIITIWIDIYLKQLNNSPRLCFNLVKRRCYRAHCVSAHSRLCSAHWCSVCFLCVLTCSYCFFFSSVSALS